MEIMYSNGTVSCDEVMKHLALIGYSHRLYSDIIRNKEVVKKAGQSGIKASDKQLQEFADNFRTLRGLHTAESTYNFLKNAGLSEDDFEAFCESAVLNMLLKEHLVDERAIEEYFVDNRADFDSARISSIVVKDQNLAKEIIMQVMEDGADFHKLAREHSLDERIRYAGGYVGMISRRMFEPDIAAKVFNASEGDVLGPFKQHNAFQVILVEEVRKDELTDDVKDVIREHIFSEWVSHFLKDGISVNP